MVRVVVLLGVLFAVGFHGGGALADVRFEGLNVALRQADGTRVTVRVTSDTRIVGARRLRPGLVVVSAQPRPVANRVVVLRRLVVSRSAPGAPRRSSAARR
jgi:hypothetical protein